WYTSELASRRIFTPAGIWSKVIAPPGCRIRVDRQKPTIILFRSPHQESSIFANLHFQTWVGAIDMIPRQLAVPKRELPAALRVPIIVWADLCLGVSVSL